MEKNIYFGIKKGGLVLGLAADMAWAGKIAKTAAQFGLIVHNCDQAAALVDHAKKAQPLLVLVDFDSCEAEGFKVLKEFSGNADLRKVPVVGSVSQSKSDLKAEAERAGCDRVYFRTEFGRILNDLFIRYVQ